MNELSEILNLMSRMRLFPETNNLHLQNKFIIEDKEQDILEEGVFKSYDANQIYKILLKHYNIGREEYFLKMEMTLALLLMAAIIHMVH